jgi:hypothetical protein
MAPPLAAVGTASVPVLAALVAGLFAARLGGGCLARPSAARACWALGFLLFAGAAAAEAYGASYGWSPLTFRLYYLLGGVLSVGVLGLGAAWLHLPRTAALLATGGMLVAVPAAALAVFLAPVAAAALDVAGLRPPANATLGGHAYLWAIALNTCGTLMLVGGAVWSLAHRRAPLANALILAGLAAVALSGTLTRVADSYALVYVGQLAGVVAVYAGFELATRPRPLTGGPASSTPSRRLSLRLP